MERHDERKAQFMERMYICRNTTKHYTNFNVTVKYNNKINDALLSHLLRKIISKISSMRTNFYRKGSTQDDFTYGGKNYRVSTTKLIRYDDVVIHKQISGNFDEKCLEYLNTLSCPMGRDDLPLWRVVIFDSITSEEQYLTFVSDHSILDGSSVVEIHKELVKEFDHISKLTNDSLLKVNVLYDIDVDGNKPLGPSIETYSGAYRISFWQRIIYPWFKPLLFNSLRKVTNFLMVIFNLKPSLSPAYPLFRHLPITHNLDTRYKIINYSPDELLSILLVCKKRGITLTPLINLIVAKSIQDTIVQSQSDKMNEKYSILSLIAINGRRYQTVDEFLYGSLVGVEMLYTDPPDEPTDDEGIIRLAQVYAKRLNDSVKNRKSFLLLSSISFLNWWPKFQGLIGQNEGKSTIDLSNLGKLETDSTLKWRIEDAWFSQNTGTTMHTICNFVSTYKGLKLVIGYNPEFDDMFLKHEKKIQVVDEFLNLIEDRVRNISKMA